MKIGFIGTGKMSKSIIAGLLKKGFKPENIIVSAKHVTPLKAYAKNLNLEVAKNNQEVVEKADYIFLGIHPSDLTALKEIAPFINPEGQVFLSFMSGVSLTALENVLGPVKIVRLMPNLNVSVNEGTIAYTFSEEMPEDAEDILQLLNTLGKTYSLEEKDYPTFVALAGSSPAFIYLFIDAMSRVGVKYGIPKNLATEIAANACLGSAKLLLERGKNPWELVDNVSSPNGSTVQGVLALENAGFLKAVNEGLEAILTMEDQREK